MKVAYFVGAFPTVSETFVINQIAGMAARGCDVEIFATADATAGEPPEAVMQHRLTERLYRLDAPKQGLVRIAQVAWLLLVCGWRAPVVVVRALNVARHGRTAATLGLLYAALVVVRHGKRRFDIVHAQFGTYAMLAMKLIETGALSGKVVVSFRGYDVTKFLRETPHAYDELFRQGNLFLPVSQAVANRAVAAGCDPAKIEVHHSGIDCAKFRHPQKERGRNESTAVLIVGRLVEKKGIADGIAAIARVVALGRVIHCTIIGDGPLHDALQGQIEELGISAYVRLIGAKRHDEVIEQMARSHILIAPSVTASDGDEEGIPNTLKEAMAMSLPVISTRHSGIPELVEDGVSGYLVRERDVAALADRLTQLVDDPEKCAAMGRRGRDRVEAEFAIERLNDRLLELYRGLRDQGAAPVAPTERRSTESAGANRGPQGACDSRAERAPRH